jgi:hypothetical protein
VSNIIIPVQNMNKPDVYSYLTQSESANWFSSKWPETLIAQHSELYFEIESINELLGNNICSLIQLDVRLKKLTKAVLTHLELEANFLTPILILSKVSTKQKDYLNLSFDVLFTTCQATIDYIHSLKLKFGNCYITVTQSERIINFLDEIKKKLNDEDTIYSQMTAQKGADSEV